MNPCDFKANMDFSQKTMPEVVRLLKENARHFLVFESASQEEDLHYATDIVISFRGGKIAVRVRRPIYKYRDLTIRTVQNGKRTEIHKILDGFADFLFYGWANDKNEIEEYLLVDLGKLRQSGLLEDWQAKTIMNKDQKTGFLPISPFALLSTDVLLAHRLNQEYLWGGNN